LKIYLRTSHYFSSVFREEENYFGNHLSYSYSYSYGSYHNVSNKNKALDLINVETLTLNDSNKESTSPPSDAPIAIHEEAIDEQITDSPTVEDHNAVDDKVENVSPVVTSMTGESNAVNATNELLSTDAVKANSIDTEGISSLAKTMIGVGIGLVAVVALLSLRKRQH